MKSAKSIKSSIIYIAAAICIIVLIQNALVISQKGESINSLVDSNTHYQEQCDPG